MMRKFHIQFTEKNLTGNAGLVHMGRFVDKLGLEKIIGRHLTIQRAGNAKYAIPQVLMMLMMGAIQGVKHMSHMALLKNDGVIRRLFNWTSFPDAATFGRVFRRFTHKHCDELSEAEAHVRRKVWRKKYFRKVTLDMDSTVRGVYGSQEGAKKGYNPKKNGQRSYHPLMCFIAETRECLHNWFRSGDAYSANGCVDFMRECLVRLPNRARSVDVRADSAFFNGELLDLLEEKSARYVIKVKMKGLEALLHGMKWRKIKNRPDWQSAEFEYQCGEWARPRRFVAVRTIKSVDDNGLLFPEDGIKYDFFCYVSNKDMSPWMTHKYYGQRATSENWIEWCKNQMASGSILTQEFWANSAIFQASVMAYNLVVWMMWLHDEKGFREEPNTIRMLLIHVPARLKHAGRQWFLRLSRDYPFKERWTQLEQSIMTTEFA